MKKAEFNLSGAVLEAHQFFLSFMTEHILLTLDMNHGTERKASYFFERRDEKAPR